MSFLRFEFMEFTTGLLSNCWYDHFKCIYHCSALILNMCKNLVVEILLRSDNAICAISTYCMISVLFHQKSTLQMLTNIENRLEELFEMIETMPQDKVEAAEKVMLNFFLV